MSLRKRLTTASIGRRAYQLGQVARHPARHWRSLRLLALARHQGLAADDASTGWKYLGEYLAGGLDTATRAALIASHYTFLLDRLPADGLRRSWATGVTLWEHRADDRGYAIRLDQATVCPMEGESQLCFHRNGARLFTLTFTLVDGTWLGLADGPALFIGGMQGGYACQQDSRTAARDNGEIAPAAMLILAVRAVAGALGIAHIAAVSSKRQASASYAGDKIRFRYDDWWEQLGSQRIAGGLFLLDPPGKGLRSLDHLSAPHRKRALRKARLKAELGAGMLDAFQRRLAEPPVSASVPPLPHRARWWLPELPLFALKPGSAAQAA